MREGGADEEGGCDDCGVGKGEDGEGVVTPTVLGVGSVVTVGVSLASAEDVRVSCGGGESWIGVEEDDGVTVEEDDEVTVGPS